MTTNQKLIIVWVDNTGIELTGRYHDSLRHYPETRAIPKASAATFSDDTPARRKQLEKHVAVESHNHEWMGFYLLDYKDDILATARKMALADYANRSGRTG